MDTSLTAKTALITGGSLGLGLAMAGSRRSGAGANVAISARRPELLLRPLPRSPHKTATVRWLISPVMSPSPRRCALPTHEAGRAERFGPSAEMCW